MSYNPNKAPASYEPGWVDRELERLEQALQVFDSVRLVETNVEPPKPRTGEIRLADGTNWNPGAGAGFYGFYGGVWVKLG